MRVTVGSANPTKIMATQQAFTLSSIRAQVEGKEVASGVSKQPIGHDETRRGALHRAKLAVVGSDIGIGLEAGVVKTEDTYFLCNWGALATSDGTTFVAGGLLLPLPAFLSDHLEKGQELGPLVDHYWNRENTKQQEGIAGILTNNRVRRTDLFSQLVLPLIGQWEIHYT